MSKISKYCDKIEIYINNLASRLKQINNSLGNNSLDEILEYLDFIKIELSKTKLEIEKIQADNDRYLSELYWNQKYLESVYENLNAGVFVIDIKGDDEFIFTGANPYYESITNNKIENIRNKKLHEILPPGIDKILTANLKKCLDLREIVKFDITSSSQNEEKCFVTKLVPVINRNHKIWRIIGIKIDVTDQKKAEISIKREHLFISSLLDTVPDPIFYKDTNLKFIGCNKAYEEFMGKDRESIIGKTVNEVAPGLLADYIEKKDRELFSNPPYQKYEYRHQEMKGLLKSVHISKAVFYDEQNRIAGLIGIIHDITEEVEHQIMLKDLTLSDVLTGLYNRRGFDELSRHSIHESINNNKPISLLMIDIDYFKKYNDTYGHQAGDECLKKIALTIKKSCMRNSDIAARYGGEEFIAILPDTNNKNAVIVANRILTSVNNLKIEHKSSDYKVVTVSIGVATLSGIIDINDLIKNADKCLYRAKKSGRNRIEK